MSKRNGGGAIRVMVVATSAVRRAGLEAIIRSQPDFQLAGSSSTLARVRSSGQAADIDIVLMDCESAPNLTADSSSMQTMVLLTEPGDARTVSRLLRNGVHAILPRESDPDDIVSAIFAAYCGLVLLSADSAHQLANIYGDPTPETDDMPLPEITARETEVLRMLASGLSNRDIARRLGISEHTAKFHISSILHKLDAASRTEAVTLAIRRGLIPV